MRDSFERVLALQKHWTSQNTSEMQERGLLIRRDIPDWLRTFQAELAASLGISSNDLIIEGRDATGPKAEIPWVRFGDRRRTPSATMDWYCVYLFDAEGEEVFLSLGHGSTVWDRGEYRPRPETELAALAEWGRGIIADHFAERGDLLAAISLKSRRTKLGHGYELGTSVACSYAAGNVPSDASLKADALQFAGLLNRLYSSAVPSPEQLEAVEASVAAAGRRTGPQSRGQGFGLTPAERKAVELRGMKLAEELLRDEGWACIDTSQTRPYDLHCRRGDEELFVEVKATTSSGGTVVLTRGEVRHHQAAWPLTALVLVTEVELERGDGGPTATGGSVRIVSPWRIDSEALEPISYAYRVPN